MDPAVAFAGTLHVASEYYASWRRRTPTAAAGRVPPRCPGSVVCHTLTDPSILGDAASDAAHADVTSACTPRRRCSTPTRATQGPRPSRGRSPRSTQHLVDPIESCLARDAAGRPVHRGEDPAGHRGRAGDARRPHASTATSTGRGPPTGRGSRPPPSSGACRPTSVGAALRRRRPPRRRRLRHRRPQRRAGRPGLAAAASASRRRSRFLRARRRAGSVGGRFNARH